MSWNSALDRLYPNQVIKQGWGNILCGLGDALGARYSPIVSDLCTTVINGQATPAELSFGVTSASDRSSQTSLRRRATVDTLFALNGDVATYDYPKAADVPVKMMWY